jgi:hypothetical protein
MRLQRARKAVAWNIAILVPCIITSVVWVNYLTYAVAVASTTLSILLLSDNLTYLVVRTRDANRRLQTRNRRQFACEPQPYKSWKS